MSKKRICLGLKESEVEFWDRYRNTNAYEKTIAAARILRPLWQRKVTRPCAVINRAERAAWLLSPALGHVETIIRAWVDMEKEKRREAIRKWNKARRKKRRKKKVTPRKG